MLRAMMVLMLSATAFLAAAPDHRFLDRTNNGAIRVLTWNIYRDSIFPPAGEVVDVAAANRPAQFARVLRAINPDVICLQQVDVGAERSATLVGEILPLPDGRAWQAHTAIDTVILSRYDIIGRDGGYVDGERRRGHSIALIQAPSTQLYVVCAHFQSSDGPEDIAERRRQARVIGATLRDAKAGVGAVPLRDRTPFIVLGDFNAIPGSTQ